MFQETNMSPVYAGNIKAVEHKCGNKIQHRCKNENKNMCDILKSKPTILLFFFQK